MPPRLYPTSALFAQLGIPTYGIRACAKVRDDRKALERTVQELFLINLIMSILAYIVLFLAIAFVPRMRQEKALFLIVGLTILFNAIGMEWLYKALEQYTYITVRSIIFKLIAVVAMFVLVHEQKDYVIYGGISILAASASNVFNFFHAHKYVSIKPVGSYNFRQHLKPIVIFFAMSCAATIYTNLDTVMLGFMTSDAEVGYYNAAVKIKSILVSVVTSLGVVLLPRASYYVECKLMDKFCRITHVALNFVILISVPLTVLLYFVCKGRHLFSFGSRVRGLHCSNADHYADVAFYWTNEYHGHSDVDSVRKRKGCAVFGDCRSRCGSFIECSIDSIHGICRCGHWNRCGRGCCFCRTVLGTQKRSPFFLSEGTLWNHCSGTGTGYCKLSVGENDCSWIICITTCIGHLVFCSIWRSPCSSKRTSCLADGREGTADAIQKKKNWVACHVSVMLSRPFVRACVGASQEGMISSIGKTFIIRKGNVVPLGTVLQLDFH